MTWWAPLLAAAITLLLTYGVLRVLAFILIRDESGWFFTSRSTRNLAALGGTALLGPFAAVALEGLRRAGRLLWDGSSWWTFGWACLFVISAGWWFFARPFRSPPWPPPVKEFLSQWEALGLGAAPVVEVTTEPDLVRLRFSDSAVLTGQARILLDQLESALAPRFRLVIWLGGKPVS